MTAVRTPQRTQCAVRTQLAPTCQQAARDVRDDLTSLPDDVATTVRCVRESHAPDEPHHSVARHLPARFASAVWVSWYDGQPPHAIDERPYCTQQLLSLYTRCHVFDEHPGGHTWQLEDTEGTPQPISAPSLLYSADMLCRIVEKASVQRADTMRARAAELAQVLTLLIERTDRHRLGKVAAQEVRHGRRLTTSDLTTASAVECYHHAQALSEKVRMLLPLYRAQRLANPSRQPTELIAADPHPTADPS